MKAELCFSQLWLIMNWAIERKKMKILTLSWNFEWPSRSKNLFTSPCLKKHFSSQVISLKSKGLNCLNHLHFPTRWETLHSKNFFYFVLIFFWNDKGQTSLFCCLVLIKFNFFLENREVDKDFPIFLQISLDALE